MHSRCRIGKIGISIEDSERHGLAMIARQNRLQIFV